MTRLLLCAATILALTASANAQSVVPLSDRTLSWLCRCKAALVHLVSRKGLHRLAGARRKVHMSTGQHVHELQTAARSVTR
jgi:hypothetical protein